MAVVYMTEDGYKKLADEIAQMEAVDRKAISAQIAEARDKGDLSENAEYDAAKEAQGMLEMKIAQMKETLANARIIDESKLKTDSVQILNTVRVKNLANKQEMTYTLVSENEANIREGKLAINTPIGKGLLGKKIGEVAEINVPAGLMRFEVVSISL
ncbi:MAG: transcription elongation factor GreA [Bacteroidetes bacterium]|jgi:transcription elongation factor greA|nr:transcription elongation factor GreA [Bacteroidetes oral taxon 274 str. F0058]RKV84405.1 MAG: transcription elongation factor GreA [Bacteroidota bacterium]